MESKAARVRRVKRIIEVLHQTYPGATCELTHDNPYQLLVATILSAQCTDKRVNMVTPALFERWPTAADLAEAGPEELEKAIQSTGFFRNKAKSLLGMSRAVVERHGGCIPDSMDELRDLPGVGRKTANVVLGTAFHKEEGVVVDTHVGRISRLLALTDQSDPEKIERDLMTVVPRKEWTNFSHLLIHHGRNICVARKPRCEVCPLYDLCPGHRPLHDEPARKRQGRGGALRKGAR
jgi:endonuclease-3